MSRTLFSLCRRHHTWLHKADRNYGQLQDTMETLPLTYQVYTYKLETLRSILGHTHKHSHPIKESNLFEMFGIPHITVIVT